MDSKFKIDHGNDWASWIEKKKKKNVKTQFTFTRYHLIRCRSCSRSICASVCLPVIYVPAHMRNQTHLLFSSWIRDQSKQRLIEEPNLLQICCRRFSDFQVISVWSRGLLKHLTENFTTVWCSFFEVWMYFPYAPALIYFLSILVLIIFLYT